MKIKTKRITPKHCCATCDKAKYEGIFECALDPENITWDSGEIERDYSTVCSHWTKQPPYFRMKSSRISFGG
jgi:hypothetical protein